MDVLDTATGEQESPIQIMPLNKGRKVRKDKGTAKPHLRKPNTVKRITNKEIVENMTDLKAQVAENMTDLKAQVSDIVDKLGPYYPQPAAEMSLPDNVDYVALEKIPGNNQLENSMSESESFRDSTRRIFNQILIPSGNLTSGGLRWA